MSFSNSYNWSPMFVNIQSEVGLTMLVQEPVQVRHFETRYFCPYVSLLSFQNFTSFMYQIFRVIDIFKSKVTLEYHPICFRFVYNF